MRTHVGRIRWFAAGAAAAAGALAVSPGAYRRLRGMVAPGAAALPEPAPEAGTLDPAAELWPADVSAPRVVEGAVDEEPVPYEPAQFDLPGEEDTQELRLRIDQTRARVRERAVAERRGEAAGENEDEAEDRDLGEGSGDEGEGGGEAAEQDETPPCPEEGPSD